MESNNDICILMGVNKAEGKLLFYSPIEKKNFEVSVTDETIEEYDIDDAIALEIDLDNKRIVN